MKKIKIIEMCLGSSCFARGSGEYIHVVENFLKTHALEKDCELKGCLCSGDCNHGPHLHVDEKKYGNLTKAKLVDILNGLLK